VWVRLPPPALGQGRVIARVGRSEWSLLRSLRLRALGTDPLSFGSTHDREAAFADDEWQTWAAEDSAGDASATFLATSGGQPIGMVAAYRDDDETGLFHVVAMWVAPEARRQGVGADLLSHVLEWTRSCGGSVVQLNVTTAADDARRLYLRNGFAPDGASRESRHTAGVVEISLRKTLA
jgi:GNAT superfamily N-acetyltransferase